MGSFDGAEICELVGLFLLQQLAQVVGIDNIGLYRDDGLAILKNATGPVSERIKKNIISIFQRHGLKIIAETNLVQTDFLDVTMNLETGRFWPFRKPNDQPLYIHRLSNHPPTIKKQLPSMLAKRLSELSYDRSEFEKATPIYKEAMLKSGYQQQLEHFDKTKTKKKKLRKRNVIWFNPPYSDNVETNIGKKFLQLLTKHFPPNHRLHKICNKFNVKVSYSCMPNMKSIISNHNKNILRKHSTITNLTPPCNCKIKTKCPLDGKCRERSIVYKASLISNNITKYYYGCCETDFKSRYYNHIQSFKFKRKRNATELSKAFWKEKDAGLNPQINWSIVAKTKPYKPGSKSCNLCLTEKLVILKANPSNTLNKRSELNGKCRHLNKFKLNNYS